MEVKKEKPIQNPWTKEEDEKLKSLWLDYSSYQLATVFGRSRMSIISRANRMGMKKGISKRDRARGDKLRSSSLKNVFVRDRTYEISRVKLAPTKPSQIISVEPFLGVHFSEIKSDQCRYMKEASTLVYCGHDVQKKSSYCPNHHKHMYTGERAINRRNHRYFAR